MRLWSRLQVRCSCTELLCHNEVNAFQPPDAQLLCVSTSSLSVTAPSPVYRSAALSSRLVNPVVTLTTQKLNTPGWNDYLASESEAHVKEFLRLV